MSTPNPPGPAEDGPEKDFEDSAAGEAPGEEDYSPGNLREVAERLGAGLPANDDAESQENSPAAGKQKTKPAFHSEDAGSPLLNPQLSLELEKQAADVPLSAETETQAETPVAPPPRRPLRAGEILKKARVAGGYSLDEVAQEVKIKPQYLLAIEEGRASELPSRTHAVGFVRVYAGALGLDAAALADRFRAEAGSSIPVLLPALPVPEPVTDRHLPGALLVAAVLVLALIVYLVGANSLRSPAKTAPLRPVLIEAAHHPPPPPVAEQRPQSQPPPVSEAPAAVTINAPPPQPEVEAAPQPEAAPPTDSPPQQEMVEEEPSAPLAEEPVNTTPPLQIATSRIRLEALEDTTVQIFDAEGGLIAERNIRAGEAFFVPDKSGYTLATGNAGAIRLQVDGYTMPPIGVEDEAMHNIPLNPALLLKYLQ